MSRAAFLTAVLTLMPEACGKVLGQHPAPTAEPPPPVVPVSSATAPPIWAPPPDPNAGTPYVPPAPTSSSTAVSPELAKARGFAQQGDNKKVRAALEKKVRSGKSSREEAQLLFEACTTLKDRVCADMVKAKHPEVELP